MFSFDNQQNLIKVVDTTTAGNKDAKEETSTDNISVQGLTPELFQQITQQPKLIANHGRKNNFNEKQFRFCVGDSPGIWI